MVTLTRLRYWRERKPMTQQELAEAAGLNRVTVADIERRKADPRPSTIRRLADVLGVAPEELY